MKPLAELETTEDAGRSMPSYGAGWDAAIEEGIDVALLESNLRLTPAERIQALVESNRWVDRMQARSVPEGVLRIREDVRLQEKLAALGPETED